MERTVKNKKKKRLLDRLRGSRGESLGEVLIAVLVAAMGLAILAAMISSSTKIVLESEQTVKEYVSKEGALVAGSGEPAAGSIAVSIDNEAAPRRLTDVQEDTAVSVNFYTNTELGGKAVISYKAVD